MVSPELYGVILAASVLAIVVGILAFERLTLKESRPNREVVEIRPSGSAVNATIKGGSQGI